MLEINEGDAVTIKQIEVSIITRAWKEGWVTPKPPPFETGRSVAVVGSARRAWRRAAAAPRRPRVTLFERDEAAGGLVRFGVPDFKIEKTVVERRVDQLVAEGVEMRYGVDVGRDITGESCGSSSTRWCWRSARACRATSASPARELDGVHFAMDYLYQRNRWVAARSGRSRISPSPRRSA